MNTRYFSPPDSLCNSGSTVSFSANSAVGEDRGPVISRNRSSRAPPSTFLIRMAMRISRARWFTFLRRVFHYQNGSRSNLGSNPFNSSTWMMLEFIALIVQISTTTFTLAISKREKPVWPMRIWIVGYDIGCLLSLLLLYGRYRHVTQGDGFGLSDLEQQRGIEDSSSVLGYNMHMGSAERGASDDQISRLPSWNIKQSTPVWRLAMVLIAIQPLQVKIRWLVESCDGLMLDYNVPRGKLYRGLAVIDCYKSLKEGKELTEEEILLASVLGWCVEWLQACAVVLDDIMDNSHTRRGRPCWFRLPKVGFIAINDGILLLSQVHRILKMYFREKPYYVHLLDLFNEVV
ncbi:hypothetical protein GH714_006664 [Hevea brasiliensis]|uniref:Uncharacterized protein n=1 Tax=Hevea brasiliensis TaxID=3981 RepID=A0A6A6LK38_HEVBR|nr:hypothetical protein GH714_006664 [Hevea brasiliensis]